jgi:8-hydroxy-5-deazaflavin:NADPH oxidoreductase
MKTIVIGTGRMAKGIVKTLSKVYPNEIGLYSRDIEKARATIEELQIECNSVSLEDLFNAEIIIHTLWYKDILEFVAKYKEQLKVKY